MNYNLQILFQESNTMNLQVVTRRQELITHFYQEQLLRQELQGMKKNVRENVIITEDKVNTNAMHFPTDEVMGDILTTVSLVTHTAEILK